MSRERRATGTRRARGRGARIEQRLEHVKRARAARTQSPLRDHNPKKPARTAIRRALLFVFPLAAGALLASTAVDAVREWWRGTPAQVESIAVLGNVRLSGAEVAAATGLSRGAPLEGLSEADIEARVALQPWVRTVRVAVLPMGTVVVEIEERSARAQLHTAAAEGTGSRYLVDDECTPFLQLDPYSAHFDALPSIATSGRAPAAGDAALCLALTLAESLQRRSEAGVPHLGGYEVVLPSAASPGFVLREETRHEVLLGRGSDAELDERLDRLGQLFAANPSQLARATSIDLRFADQAVLRSQGISR